MRPQETFVYLDQPNPGLLRNCGSVLGSEDVFSSVLVGQTVHWIMQYLGIIERS